MNPFVLAKAGQDLKEFHRKVVLFVQSAGSTPEDAIDLDKITAIIEQMAARMVDRIDEAADALGDARVALVNGDRGPHEEEAFPGIAAFVSGGGEGKNWSSEEERRSQETRPT